MFYVYILKSLLNGRFYVGHSDDLAQRVREHDLGMCLYTRRWRPWELVHTEQFETRSAAMKREREIKKRKSRKYILGLIGHPANQEGERLPLSACPPSLTK
jgi:putative endonuclease